MIQIHPKTTSLIAECDEVIEPPNQVPAIVKVSVLVQTYNHEDTIAQCLDGILMQSTDFEFEILLGEDESNDRTRDICIAYAEKYPEKIRLFLHRRENNIHINGKPSGKFNSCFNYSKVRGEYFAICEGDDFWTDNQKLQKQVEALDDNPNATLCYTRVNLMDRSGNVQSDEQSITEKRFRQITDSSRLSISPLLEVGNFIHTCSMMGRSNALDIPFEFIKSPVGDYLLYILLTQNGQEIIKLDNPPTAVYRNETGTWSAQSHRNILINIALYQSCVLSILQNEEHREIFLDRAHSHIIQIGNYIDQIKQREPAVKELFAFLVRKVRRKLHL